jgi:hypothetical protein
VKFARPYLAGSTALYDHVRAFIARSFAFRPGRVYDAAAILTAMRHDNKAAAGSGMQNARVHI